MISLTSSVPGSKLGNWLERLEDFSSLELADIYPALRAGSTSTVGSATSVTDPTVPVAADSP